MHTIRIHLHLDLTRNDVLISMTKKQAAAKKAAWRLALSEGRVIRYTSFDAALQCDQFSFVAYATKELAEETLRVQLARIGRRESIHTDVCIAPAVSA